MTKRTSIWCCGVAALLLTGSETSSAYVRSRTQDSCKPVFWRQSCVYVQPDSAFVADMAGSDVERIIQKSISNWMTRTSGSFVRLNYRGADGRKEVTYKDHLSVVIFRTGNRFCRPSADGNAQVCYDASAAAVTTVSYINKKDDPDDGLIVDADIELNSVNNQFVEIGKTLPPADNRNQTDLENTLTHELGHLLGLDHTCRLSTDPSCLTDDKGQARQTCDAIDRQRLLSPAAQTIYETSMFAIAPPKDVEKRTPKSDDVAGVVAASPIASDPKLCPDPVTGSASGCSCQVGGANRNPLAVSLAVLSVLLGILFRRRKTTS